jgi:hypothetical protein
MKRWLKFVKKAFLAIESILTGRPENFKPQISQISELGCVGPGLIALLRRHR